VHRSALISHPQLGSLLVFVEHPDVASFALALLHERLREHAEEALGALGVAREQIERELGRVGLHPHEAICVAALLDLVEQRCAELGRVGRKNRDLDL
jgi:hypothetical protein